MNTKELFQRIKDGTLESDKHCGSQLHLEIVELIELSDDEVAQVFDYIANNPYLDSIQLEVCGGFMFEQVVDAIIANPKITHVDFSKNDISDERMPIICEMLRRSNSIISLSLYKNKISDRGAEMLAKVLQSKNCVLESLDIRCNPIWFVGAKHIFEALKKNTTLSKVSIDNYPPPIMFFPEEEYEALLKVIIANIYKSFNKLKEPAQNCSWLTMYDYHLNLLNRVINQWDYITSGYAHPASYIDNYKDLKNVISFCKQQKGELLRKSHMALIEFAIWQKPELAGIFERNLIPMIKDIIPDDEKTPDFSALKLL